MKRGLLALLLFGCGEPASSEAWRWVGDDAVEIEVPASIQGGPTDSGWRGTTGGQTRCGPTVVTLETSATAVPDDVRQEGHRCTSFSHVRSIRVGDAHRVVRCVMNEEDEGWGAPTEPCRRIVASLRRR